jgi:hypothetical protein
MRATVWRGGQPDHVGRGHLAHQAGVEFDAGALGVQNLEDLRLVGARILAHVVLAERRAGGVLARRVADHAGEVADQEDDLVAELLEPAHLVDQHRVADVQVRRRRVEAGLDHQRPAFGQFRAQRTLRQHLFGTPGQFLELLFGGNLGHGSCRQCCRQCCRPIVMAPDDGPGDRGGRAPRCESCPTRGRITKGAASRTRPRARHGCIGI